METETFCYNLRSAMRNARHSQNTAITRADRELHRLSMHAGLNAAHQILSALPVRSVERKRAVTLFDAAAAVCRSKLI